MWTRVSMLFMRVPRDEMSLCKTAVDMQMISIVWWGMTSQVKK